MPTPVFWRGIVCMSGWIAKMLRLTSYLVQSNFDKYKTKLWSEEVTKMKNSHFFSTFLIWSRQWNMKAFPIFNPKFWKLSQLTRELFPDVFCCFAFLKVQKRSFILLQKSWETLHGALRTSRSKFWTCIGNSSHVNPMVMG